MLKDYTDYIEDIRNNLIQNDILLSAEEINSYESAFYFSLILEQVCWFYQKLLLINSEYAVRSTMYLYGDEYIEKVRQSAHKEFISIFNMYKPLSTGYHVLNQLEKEIEELKAKDTKVDIDIDMDEELDLDGIIENEEEISSPSREEKISPKTFLSLVESSSTSDESVVQLSHTVEVVHGIFIDEWSKEKDEDINRGIESDSTEENTDSDESDDELSSLLDELFGEDDEEDNDFTEVGVTDVDVDTSEIEEEPTNIEVIHGIFIDEYSKPKEVVEDNTSSNQEDNAYTHGIFIDEWVKDESNVKETKQSNEGSEVHGIFIDEWVKPTKSSHYDENEDDDDSEDAWGDITDSDGWGDEVEDEDEDRGITENKSNFSKSEDKTNISKEYNSDTKNVEQNRDISDSIQDITNRLLTEGKQIFSKGFKKF